MQAKLRVVDGKASRSEVPLKLPVVIGRSGDAGLKIKHKLISRAHCELFEKEGYLYLRDNNSLNGTFVGGQRISEVLLNPGDQFTVGPLTFEAVYEPPPAPPMAEPTATIDMQSTLHSATPAVIDFSALEEASTPPADEAALNFLNFDAAPSPAAGSEATLDFNPSESTREIEPAAAEPADWPAAESPAQTNDEVDMSWLTGVPAAEPAEEPAAAPEEAFGQNSLETSTPEPEWGESPAEMPAEDEPEMDFTGDDATPPATAEEEADFSWLAAAGSQGQAAPAADDGGSSHEAPQESPAEAWTLDLGGSGPPSADQQVADFPGIREEQDAIQEHAPSSASHQHETPEVDDSWLDEAVVSPSEPETSPSPDVASEYQDASSVHTAIAEEPTAAEDDFPLGLDEADLHTPANFEALPRTTPEHGWQPDALDERATVQPPSGNEANLDEGFLALAEPVLELAADPTPPLMESHQVIALDEPIAASVVVDDGPMDQPLSLLNPAEESPSSVEGVADFFESEPATTGENLAEVAIGDDEFGLELSEPDQDDKVASASAPPVGWSPPADFADVAEPADYAPASQPSADLDDEFGLEPTEPTPSPVADEPSVDESWSADPAADVAPEPDTNGIAWPTAREPVDEIAASEQGQPTPEISASLAEWFDAGPEPQSPPGLMAAAEEAIAEMPVCSTPIADAPIESATAPACALLWAAAGPPAYQVFGRIAALSVPVAVRPFQWVATPAWETVANGVPVETVALESTASDLATADSNFDGLPETPLAAGDPWEAPLLVAPADDATQHWNPQAFDAQEPAAEVQDQLPDEAELMDLTESESMAAEWADEASAAGQDWSAPPDLGPLADGAEPGELAAVDETQPWEDAGDSPIDMSEPLVESDWNDEATAAWQAPPAPVSPPAIPAAAAPPAAKASPAAAKPKSRWWPFGKKAKQPAAESARPELPLAAAAAAPLPSPQPPPEFAQPVAPSYEMPLAMDDDDDAVEPLALDDMLAEPEAWGSEEPLAMPQPPPDTSAAGEIQQFDQDANAMIDLEGQPPEIDADLFYEVAESALDEAGEPAEPERAAHSAAPPQAIDDFVDDWLVAEPEAAANQPPPSEDKSHKKP